jgi:N-acetylglucosaminyldiphosphoundecaprenol N-acetyl-beta-D-mannosaminyltransferase
MRQLPRRHDVFGTAISLTSVDEVVDHVLSGDAGVVVIANVHSVMTSRKNRTVATAVEEADIATPDGMPLVWALKASGLDSAVRVTGIEVMRECFDRGRSLGTGHFLYGSTEPVLEALVSSIERDFPGARVAGVMSPPFRELTDDDLSHHAAEVLASDADIVWVGLGMPKQELWMARAHRLLPGVTLVGVGAAFDWMAGNKRLAPQWMRDRGLEWVYRLITEPRRMWRRYAYNNPAFLALLIRRWVTRAAGRLAGRGRGEAS